MFSYNIGNVKFIVLQLSVIIVEFVSQGRYTYCCQTQCFKGELRVRDLEEGCSQHVRLCENVGIAFTLYIAPFHSVV